MKQMKSFTFPLMFLPFLISSLSAHKMKLVEITSCISLLTAAVLLYFSKSLFISMFQYGSSRVFNKYIFFLLQVSAPSAMSSLLMKI